MPADEVLNSIRLVSENQKVLCEIPSILETLGIFVLNGRELYFLALD